ncbi:DHA2 family efflux MFS transporter permease subunit [Streptomyces sp. SR27]|uniref:DHA2 family efflux MFS transporter permease subunit n=1 Tax=Streptomyces sp. SR27 TaxID=3076630 RepID=UPI00295B8EE1|nr:DHA2 family efflux MFS transporter permease subunit [Streptomyces sp. SR27]MDV9189946.1 DHA2 family efflux MFS transporter permease subunit [Streptomyces sp. SR27]
MPTSSAVPTPAPTHPELDPDPDPRRWTALALICAAQFMLILDVTVVNVALPAVAADLGLGRTALTWVVTTYTLCFGGLMLLGGRLADALGARRVLLTGLALFTAASLACGLAPNADVLLAGRAVQGVGAALLSPAALALVTTMFRGAERPKALGVWAAIGGTGSAVGVLLGGALTAGPGWPWIFYVNVPVGLALLIALPKAVRPTARPLPTGKRTGTGGLDIPGALLVTTATGALVYGLVRAGDSGWTAAATLLPLLGALALYGAFAAAERRTRTPLMDLRMLTLRPVVVGSLLMLVATALLISFFFLGSLRLQYVHGLDAFRTGLLFLPVALATAIGAHLGSRLVMTVGPRACAAGGMAVAAVGCLPLAVLDPESGPWATVLPSLATAAFGLGAVFVTATTTALGLITPHEAGLASGIVNTFHELGGSLGVAIASTLALTTTPPTPSGFTTAFTACTLTAAITALTTLTLAPRSHPHTRTGPHGHGMH